MSDLPDDAPAPDPNDPDGLARKVAMRMEDEIRTTRSSVRAVELPCGYLERREGQDAVLHRDAVLQEADGAVEDMLGSDSVAPHLKFGALIAQCTKRIGPFSDQGVIGGTIMPSLTIGDRAFLLLQTRMVALGDPHYVIEPCDNASCLNEKGKRTESLYTVDLKDIKVLPMPDPMKRSYALKVKHSRGVSEAVFHPMTGFDEGRIARFETDKATLQILARLDRWDGRDTYIRPDGKNAREIITWAKTLSWEAREQLREAYVEVEGGVDTTLQLECPICGREFERELAVSGDFFRPSAILRRWKKTSNS